MATDKCPLPRHETSPAPHRSAQLQHAGFMRVRTETSPRVCSILLRPGAVNEPGMIQFYGFLESVPAVSAVS